MPHRVLKTVDGKRGDFLMVGGAAFTAIGVSYVTVETAARVAAFGWFPWLTPAKMGYFWLVVGVFCLVVSLVSRRWPRLTDVAFTAMMLIPMLHAVVLAGAWAQGIYPTGGSSAVIYMLLAGWIWVVSSWPNPRERGTDAE